MARTTSWDPSARKATCDDGLELAKRGGKNAKKRAKVAVARKLAVLMHRLWVTGEVYEPVGYKVRRTEELSAVA